MPSVAEKPEAEEALSKPLKDSQDQLITAANGKTEVKTDGNASFLRAARAGNLDKVLEYLKNGTDINTCNANGLNALHLAAKEGHVQVVEELLGRGASVDASTKKGNTALHIASLAGQFEVVQVLVQNNASVNVQSQNGFTPLYMAAQENHDSVVRFLLANGANQSLATEDGFTPLAVALQQGHDRVVAVLLENDTRGKVRLPALHIAAKKDDCKAAALLLQNDHNPDVTSKSGFTPLHIAAHYGNENIANLLIQRNADVNYPAKHHITPLHVAAKWGKANLVTLLLDKGANLETKTRDGLTPLHCAARSGHEAVVDYLVQKGAPISAKTKNGLAPLHMSAQGDHVEAARVLLVHRAPVDDVTVDYLTALHVAAHCGHVRVAKLLLDRKADPNSRALNGFTPLHIACKKNRIKVVELLLKHGASIEATTESGLTPLHVASFMGCMNIVLFLLQNGAGPDIPTVRGETPLHLAARANQSDIVRVLLRNGAQVDARAREQQTPLHIASRLGNVDIVMLLLQHGATVDATTKDLYTALHVAAKEGQDEVASVLMEHGASAVATTQKGFTPLHLASKYGNLKVARLLLQKDAPVDAEGKNGVTPLHVASHYDHQNVALLLLDKGASPHATAKNGYTPLHIAAKKNQMDIATTLLEYGAQTNAESKAGFTPLHLAAQEGHSDMVSLLIEHQADPNYRAKNGLTPLHLCAQEDRVNVATILTKNHAEIDPMTKSGYSPLHVACHFGQINMVRFLLEHNSHVGASTNHGYTPLHQAAQQGHAMIAGLLLDKKADPQSVTSQGQTPLSIAQKLGYISVVETLKVVTSQAPQEQEAVVVRDEKYRVQAPETMQETFMSDSEDEGGDEGLIGDQTYRYLTAEEMKGLGDESMNEGQEDNIMTTSAAQYGADNVDISKQPVNIGFLVSFMVDARGGAMRGCRHSGVRVIIPPRKAAAPTRITCRYVKKDRVTHPPPLMEGEALASRILELGPTGTKFLGPVIIEVPHFAALRGREREIVILRSDNGETWREHTLEATEEAVQEVLNESFDGEELSQLEEMQSHRITRILTTDFPTYFAIVSRLRQEVHAIGPEGGVVSSTVVPQVQAVFPQGALTKKIKVGLQAQPIPTEVVAKLLGNRVAVSPIVTVEPRRRKFHKPITLTIPVPQAAARGMINQYSGEAPTLRLLCSITGGTTRAQWEDVTGSTPLAFVNDCVSFTTTVSARFWLMDCRNITEAAKMATDLYKEAIYVPFMAKFVVFAKRHEEMEARLRVFCMTDDKEDKTLETQEHFVEVAKSRDIEVLDSKPQYLEFGGNLVPVMKSGEQLSLVFKAFKENRLAFNVRLRDAASEPVGRIAFMKEARVGKGEPPQTPVCNLKVTLPDKISPETTISEPDLSLLQKKYGLRQDTGLVYNVNRPDAIHKADLRVTDICNLLGSDWVALAKELNVSDADINIIVGEYPNAPSQQAMVMLRLWMQQSGHKATGNNLEKALRAINRVDIVNQCIRNLELVTDDLERAVAKTQLDQSGFDSLKQEIGASSRNGTLRRNTSLDVSYDEQDLMKESESIEDIATEREDQVFREKQKILKEDEPLESVYEREERKYVGEEKEIVNEVQRQISGIIQDAANIVKERLNKSIAEPTKADFEYLSDDDKENRTKEEIVFLPTQAQSTPLKKPPQSSEPDVKQKSVTDDVILSQSWTAEEHPEKMEEFEKSLHEIGDEAQFDKELDERSKELEDVTTKEAIPTMTPPPSPTADTKESAQAEAFEQISHDTVLGHQFADTLKPDADETAQEVNEQSVPKFDTSLPKSSEESVSQRAKNEKKHKRSESVFHSSEKTSFTSEWKLETLSSEKVVTEKIVSFSSHVVELTEKEEVTELREKEEITISESSDLSLHAEHLGEEDIASQFKDSDEKSEQDGTPVKENVTEKILLKESSEEKHVLELSEIREESREISSETRVKTERETKLPDESADNQPESKGTPFEVKEDIAFEPASESQETQEYVEEENAFGTSYDNIGFIGTDQIDIPTSAHKSERAKSPFEVCRDDLGVESVDRDAEAELYSPGYECLTYSPTAKVIEVITSPYTDEPETFAVTSLPIESIIQQEIYNEELSLEPEQTICESKSLGDIEASHDTSLQKESMVEKQIISDIFNVELSDLHEDVSLEEKSLREHSDVPSTATFIQKSLEPSFRKEDEMSSLEFVQDISESEVKGSLQESDLKASDGESLASVVTEIGGISIETTFEKAAEQIEPSKTMMPASGADDSQEIEKIDMLLQPSVEIKISGTAADEALLEHFRGGEQEVQLDESPLQLVSQVTPAQETVPQPIEATEKDQDLRKPVIETEKLAKTVEETHVKSSAGKTEKSLEFQQLFVGVRTEIVDITETLAKSESEAQKKTLEFCESATDSAVFRLEETFAKPVTDTEAKLLQPDDSSMAPLKDSAGSAVEESNVEELQVDVNKEASLSTQLKQDASTISEVEKEKKGVPVTELNQAKPQQSCVDSKTAVPSVEMAIVEAVREESVKLEQHVVGGDLKPKEVLDTKVSSFAKTSVTEESETTLSEARSDRQSEQQGIGFQPAVDLVSRIETRFESEPPVVDFQLQQPFVDSMPTEAAQLQTNSVFEPEEQTQSASRASSVSAHAGSVQTQGTEDERLNLSADLDNDIRMFGQPIHPVFENELRYEVEFKAEIPATAEGVRDVAETFVDAVAAEAQKRVISLHASRDAKDEAVFLEESETHDSTLTSEASIVSSEIIHKTLSEVRENMELARDEIKLVLRSQGQMLPEESPSDYVMKIGQPQEEIGQSSFIDLIAAQSSNTGTTTTVETRVSQPVVRQDETGSVTYTEVITETIYTVQEIHQVSESRRQESVEKHESIVETFPKELEAESMFSPCRSPVSQELRHSDHDPVCSTHSFAPTEYDTAHSSCRSHTSQEYYSAVSSLSSNTRSVDSEQISTGSMDCISETTDTVLASSSDTPAHRFDITISEDFQGIQSDIADTPVDEDFAGPTEKDEDSSSQSKMKRSAEMTFHPDRRQFVVDRSVSEDSFKFRDSPLDVELPNVSVDFLDDVQEFSFTVAGDIEEEVCGVTMSSGLQAPDIICRPVTPEPGAFAAPPPLKDSKKIVEEQESVEHASPVTLVFPEVPVKEIDPAQYSKPASHRLSSHSSIPDISIQKSSPVIERRFSFPTQDDVSDIFDVGVSERNVSQINDDISFGTGEKLDEDFASTSQSCQIMSTKVIAKRIDGDTETTYAYTMSFERDDSEVPELDIPEEEIEKEKQWIARQFDEVLIHHDLEDIAECPEDADSTTSGERKEFDKLKESLSSTPDFDVLSGKKFFSKGGEFDDVSMLSLQEFERLEREMLLENMRRQSAGSGSGSGDSINVRLLHGKGIHGDNISVSSLTEFEKLEKQIQEFVKIEDKAKHEEMMLSEIEEGHESMVSDSESCETISQAGENPDDGDDTDSDDYEQRMFEIEEIIRQAQCNIQRFDETETRESRLDKMLSQEFTHSSVIEKSDSIQSESIGDELGGIQREIHSYKVCVTGEFTPVGGKEQAKEAIEIPSASRQWGESSEMLGVEAQDQSRSSSAGTRATGYESDSLMSGSMTSSNSVAMVTSTETLELETRYAMMSSTDTILDSDGGVMASSQHASVEVRTSSRVESKEKKEVSVTKSKVPT